MDSYISFHITVIKYSWVASVIISCMVGRMARRQLKKVWILESLHRVPSHRTPCGPRDAWRVEWLEGVSST